MRRARFIDSEIIHFIADADAGVPVEEVCRTAQVSLRTFYRWRRRFGGLSEPAVMKMKEMEVENRRLRALIDNLSRRLRDQGMQEWPGVLERAPQAHDDCRPGRASTLAAERCGGAVVGRFASVRVSR
jgi:putative transposase